MLNGKFVRINPVISPNTNKKSGHLRTVMDGEICERAVIANCMGRSIACGASGGVVVA